MPLSMKGSAGGVRWKSRGQEERSAGRSRLYRAWRQYGRRPGFGAASEVPASFTLHAFSCCTVERLQRTYPRSKTRTYAGTLLTSSDVFPILSGLGKAEESGRREGESGLAVACFALTACRSGLCALAPVRPFPGSPSRLWRLVSRRPLLSTLSPCLYCSSLSTLDP